MGVRGFVSLKRLVRGSPLTGLFSQLLALCGALLVIIQIIVCLSRDQQKLVKVCGDGESA